LKRIVLGMRRVICFSTKEEKKGNGSEGGGEGPPPHVEELGGGLSYETADARLAHFIRWEGERGGPNRGDEFSMTLYSGKKKMGGGGNRSNDVKFHYGCETEEGEKRP